MEAVSSAEDAGLFVDDLAPVPGLVDRLAGGADLRGPIRIRMPMVILLDLRLSKCG